MENVALISAAKRKTLPSSAFALPKLRKYPIDTAPRTRNAAARLEQNKSDLTPAQYADAKRNIAAAAKRFGIDSEYAKKKTTMSSPSVRKGLRMRINADGGIDINHSMSDDSGSLLMPGLVELKDSDGPVWIQIAKAGTFKGYRGGAFILTSKSFEEAVRNFNATENKRIPIDFEHATEEPPSEGKIAVTGAPAQGWILQLDNRGDTLWGQVEWGDLARQYIKEGKYRYFSPAFRLNDRDKVTAAPIGTRLSSGALTNTPFLDGMLPIAARDFDAEPMTAEERSSGVVTLSYLSDCAEMRDAYDLPAIRKALRCDDFASMSDVLARCARLREIYASDNIDGVPNLDEMTTDIRNVARVPLHVDVMQALEGIEDLLEALIPSDEDEEDAEMSLADKPVASIEQLPAPVAATAPKEPIIMDSILLSEHESKLAAAVKNATAEADLTLKATEGKLTTSEARIKELETEIATLRAAETARLSAEKSKRIDVAFAQYKDTLKLTDLHREQMICLFESKPETFEKLYPVIDARTALLTARISTERPGGVALPAGVERPSLKTLADKHIAAGKSFDEAWTLAINESQGAGSAV